jgi:hypothetical protein
MKESFDWALKTLDIVHLLNGVLYDTVMAWKSFDSPGGDMDYFSDITPNARRSLCAIQGIFQKLEGRQRKLLLLKSNCSEFSRAVSQVPSLSPWRDLSLAGIYTDNQHIVGASLKSGS